MKVVVLAGGFGTRISEESHLKPKPMIEIGGMPILWHIMKLYSFLKKLPARLGLAVCRYIDPSSLVFSISFWEG